MSHIHYKFSSKLNYDTVVFDGQRITLSELKRLIMCKEKLRAGDCDLQITNAQTKEEYTDSDSMIPRNSSVIVRRIPSSGTKIHNTEKSEVQLHRAFGASRAMDDHSSTRALSFFSKMQMANLVDADVSEEDKIKAMIYQSAYDSMNVHTKPSNAISANYTCYRCGNPGHHIRNCPAKGDKNSEVPPRIKKSTGIPRSFMVEVDDPNIKGAKLTNCGRYAIPAIDAEAYAIGKKEKPPFLAKEQPEPEDEDDPIPSELLCPICSEMLTDAVVIPCCGNSYCDECIRTALLESEDHTCPTCNQSKVSPDTLIANKFLRQAVNNFKKEQGCGKSLKWTSATSQSQNLTPTPTPVPTPPPLPIQSQPQKPQQSSHNQQDSLLDDPNAANTPPLSQGPGDPPATTDPAIPPATTDPASDNDTTGISLQPLQTQPEIPENETEGKTCDDSASAASVKVSNKDPTDAPSQPLTPDNRILVEEEEPQTVNVSQDNQLHASTDPTPVHPESSVSLGSSSSSSACISGGKSESNTQQLSTIPTTSFSSTYSTTPPPLFPSLLTHAYLTAQQSHCTYPPRYSPATPIWTLPAPQGAPVPSLCSSTTTSTSSIPCLIPQEWYRYQKKKKDRSPHRVSGHRRSSSRSKSSRAKASCSYSRSSSHSGSRSRSRSKSRHRSPYSQHRDLHKHSRQPSSYSYGYKRSRSPTPSSSSSPRRHHQSRSKAPSGRKDHLHSHHHSKRVSSSSSHSRRRAERSGKEAARSEDSVSRTGSLELDSECCQQWKKEYQEWYEKYFSSFSQFHHLPFPLLGLPPPPPPPQWVSTEGSRKQLHISLDSHYHSQGRRPTEIDGCTPSSELSSDSRSPPSHSSGDSRSTPSQSCSDSSSSLSYKASDSQSPPSQSSSDGRSTPSEDRAQLSVFPERHSEKTRNKPVTLTRGNKKMKLQGPSTDDKQFKKLEDSSSLKHEEKEKKPEVKGAGSSPPDVTNCTHDSRKGKKRQSSGPQASKDSTQIQGKATMSTALETDQPVPKQDQPLEKDCERKFIESNLEKEDFSKRGKHLYSKERGRGHKGKSSKEPDGMHKEREESPGGSKASDCRSEKNRKRKVEDLKKSERGSSLPGELQCSRHLKTKAAEEPEKRVSEFLKPLDREKQKTMKKLEKKSSPLAGKDIWEEGIKVKPQMKISININLDGKRKEGNIGTNNVLENLTGKLQENANYTENRDEEEKDNRSEVNEKEPSRNQGSWSEDKLKQGEGETRLTWDFRLDKRTLREKIPGEEENTVGRKHDKEEEDFDLWHCALSGVEESATGKDKVRDDDRDEEMGESQKEQEKRGQTRRKGLMESVEVEMRMRDEDGVISSPRSNESHQDAPCAKLDDGSSTSVVGSSKGKESQEKRTEVKKLEKYTQERWKELVHNQVPQSKCEAEDEGKTRVHTDSVSVTVTHLSVINSKAEGDESQRRERHREKERNSACSWSRRSVSPSSGKDRVENSVPAGADRETRKEREKKRGRERERQQESKRSKERIREDGSGRDRAREQKHVASTRTVPTSSQFCSISTSQDAERRERQHGSSQGSNKSSSCSSGIFISFRNRESSTISRAPDQANQNVYRTQRDLSLNLKYKDKVYIHYHNIHQDPSGSDQNKDKAPGSHHSQPSLSRSCSKGRDLLPFESSKYPQRESPHLGLIQGKEGKVGKGEWKPNKADKLAREVKGERENRRMPAGQGGGSRWEDETDSKVDGEGERGGGGELEDGEMLSSQSSSVGSSPSEGNSKDDKGTEKEKKPKEQKKEKRHATPERLQEGELKKHKHKKLKKSKEGTDEETGGEEGDDRWRRESNH